MVPARSGHPIVVAPVAALLATVPTGHDLDDSTKELAVGETLEIEELLRALTLGGLHSVPKVEAVGEFATRGGIVDLFPPGQPLPIRVEFFGDEIESIRAFDPVSQVSSARIDRVKFVLTPPESADTAPGNPSSAETGAPSDSQGKAAWQAITRPKSRKGQAAHADHDETEDDEDEEDVWEELPGLHTLNEPRRRSGTPGLPGTKVDRTPTYLPHHLPPGGALVLWEPSAVQAAVKTFLERHQGQTHGTEADLLKAAAGRSLVTLSRLASAPDEITVTLDVRGVERFRLLDTGVSGGPTKPRAALDPAQSAANPLGTKLDDRGDNASVVPASTRARLRQAFAALEPNGRVIVVSTGEGEIERLRSLLPLADAGIADRTTFISGDLSGGFELPAAGLLVLTSDELFGRPAHLRRIGSGRSTRAIDSFTDLKEGDYVIHLAHGIGRFRGLTVITHADHTEEHLTIEFAGGTTVHVPVSRMDLIHRYIGGGKTRPRLATLGSKSWQNQTRAAEEAVSDLAQEMLEIQATRTNRSGIAFDRETEWLEEFEKAFPYQETQDQKDAIAAIFGDMRSDRPMDRLLCGDVGFGKTEVAMRAAFLAIENGYQVAVMAPTTVLVEQHYQTFRERMAAFPIEVGKASRFARGRELKRTLDGLASGAVDLVVGTHRLAGKDVHFANLGVLVIDEEQRFGVEIKERLKRIRSNVDVLSMSATPIPRTLHMALVGIRDISNLETAPRERQPVRTKVSRFDEDLVRDAIVRELDRGGQVFFVHNRVENIEIIRERLVALVPEASIRIGHGQMDERDLEKVMVDFVRGKFDVILATTIVESGLDIPNANTLIVNQADKFGLSELHQLRGRVGRANRPGYAYFLIDPGKMLTRVASRRLRAIEEFSALGAGFQLSMRDLEIRGAGNLLGTQQSGHIANVGYELYCNLLEEAVRSQRNLPPTIKVEVEVDLPGEAYLPTEYIADRKTKIEFYRRLARVTAFDQLAAMRHELRDRFGPSPPTVTRFLDLIELRLEATIWRIGKIYLEDSRLFFRFDDATRMDQFTRHTHKQVRRVDGRAMCADIPHKRSAPDSLIPLALSFLRGERV